MKRILISNYSSKIKKLAILVILNSRSMSLIYQ